MPGNGFAFTVLVSGEVNVFGFFGELFQLGHGVRLVFGHNIGWRKIVVNINAHVFFGQIADMAKRRLNGVSLA